MRKTIITPLTLTLLILSVCLPAFAESFSGQVVGIIDGDTIEVMHLARPERVLLHGIDCPELNQPFGQRAKQFTLKHTLNKTVKVIVHDNDNYGHAIGQVILPDMRDLSIVLVSAGLAWWQENRVPDDEVLKDIQESAWKVRRGLWVDPGPVPPWDWRRGVREPTRLNLKPGSNAPAYGDQIVYTTRTGKKYHRDGCRFLRSGRIPIRLSEAKEWYSPCSACDPPR